MTDSINWCNLNKNAKHIGEVSTSRVDGSPTGAEILTSTNEITGQVRDTLAGKFKKMDDAFNSITSSQFIVTNFGNWSTVAGQQIEEADRLKGYMHPDDSGNVYAVKGSVVLPITRPSTPIGDDRFYLASAVNEARLKEVTDSVNNLHTTRDVIQWSAGLQVKDPLQLYEYNGVEYLPNKDELPFTTGISFDTSKFDRTDGLSKDEQVRVIKRIRKDVYLSDMINKSQPYTAKDISDALADAAKNKGKIVVDDAYIVSDTITLPSLLSVESLIDSGFEHSTGNSDLLAGNTIIGVSLKGLTLVQKVSSFENRCLVFNNSTDCFSYGLDVSGYVRGGVQAIGGSNVKVLYSKFHDANDQNFTNSSDVCFYQGASNCHAGFNEMVNASRQGVLLQLGADKCKVYYNLIDGPKSYGITSYDLEGDTGYLSEHWIQNNDIRNVYGSTVFSGQTLKNTGAGIYVLNGGFLHINNNTLDNCNIETNGETLVPASLAFNGARGVINASGNIIKNPNKHGIAAFSESLGFEGTGRINISGGGVQYMKGRMNGSGLYVKSRALTFASDIVMDSTARSAHSAVRLESTPSNTKTTSIKNVSSNNFYTGIQGSNLGCLEVIGGSHEGVAAIMKLDTVDNATITGVKSSIYESGFDFKDVTDSSVTVSHFAGSDSDKVDILTRGNCPGLEIVGNSRNGKIKNGGAGARIIGYSTDSNIDSYQRGDIYYSKNPVADGYVGKVCVASGPSGTAVVKSFGKITA